MIFFDTHTHLYDERCLAIMNVDEIISEARKAGVHYLCNVGTDLETSKIAIKQSRKSPTIWAYAGFIPQSLPIVFDFNQINELENLIESNRDKVIGIGEIGFDYYSDSENAKTQLEVLHAQLKLAEKLDLPVNIHCRNSYCEFDAILDDYPNVKGIMHCYTHDLLTAKKFIKRGFLISIPGVATFKNATSLHQTIKDLPLNKIVLETDASWLTPHPYRGKVNFPKYLPYTAEAVAKIKNITVEEVSSITTQNALNFFNLNS